MSEIIRGHWAQAICNDDFICVETYSGYRGGHSRDPKGKQNFLTPSSSDELLGAAVLDAIVHSRFVLGAPREGSVYPPDVEFDMELYDYKLSAERHTAWTKDLMTRFDYKTKRSLFQKMRNCFIESKSGSITIKPSCHQKLEQWGRESADEFEDVVVSADSTPAEIGSALRLAFSRCTDY